MVNGGEYVRLYEKKKEETISYGVIGLGKFGYTLAIQLAEYGYDFLVVDKDENLVQDLRTVTESAIVVDDYDKKSIKDSGVKNCDVVIVCLEEQLEKSLLVTLNLINLGIKKVISVADTSEHGEILEKLALKLFIQSGIWRFALPAAFAPIWFLILSS